MKVRLSLNLCNARFFQLTLSIDLFICHDLRMCELIMNNKLNSSTAIGLDIKTVAILQEEKLQQLERGLDIEDRSSKGFLASNKRKKKKGRGRRKKKKKVPK